MSRVVVIDDDASIRMLVRAVLEQNGYEVIEANEGTAGLRAFERGGVDLVITDILMPVKEGIETIRSLRKLDTAVPILAMSSVVRDGRPFDYLQIARALGATETIRKPLDLDELLDVVARLLAETSR